jgi:hypothetical protein
MKWHTVDEKPKYDKKVYCYSPIYEVGNAMRFRILDSQFIRMCNEITHWAYCEDDVPE